jgi:hypothetical protein
VSVVRYQESRLTVTMNHSAGTAEVSLSDAAGDPIPNRLVSLDGASVENMTTDANGRATLPLSETLAHAHFAGDNWRESPSTTWKPTPVASLPPRSLQALPTSSAISTPPS